MKTATLVQKTSTLSLSFQSPKPRDGYRRSFVQRARVPYGQRCAMLLSLIFRFVQPVAHSFPDNPFLCILMVTLDIHDIPSHLRLIFLANPHHLSGCRLPASFETPLHRRHPSLHSFALFAWDIDHHPRSPLIGSLRNYSVGRKEGSKQMPHARITNFQIHSGGGCVGIEHWVNFPLDLPLVFFFAGRSKGGISPVYRKT